MAITGRRTIPIYKSLHQSLECLITDKGNTVKVAVWRTKSDVPLLHVSVSTAPGQGSDEDSLVRLLEKMLRGGEW